MFSVSTLAWILPRVSSAFAIPDTKQTEGKHRKQSHAKPCKEISNVLTHLVKTRMENEIAPKKQLRLNTKQCSKTLKHVAQLYKATQMFSIIK